MVNAVFLQVLHIISLSCMTITFLPQVILNFRLKHTKNLSTTTIILWIIGAEITVVYLIWANEFVIICVAYGIFTGLAIFIGCQIRYYKRKKESEISKSKFQLLKRSLQFSGNYILLLIWSVINGLALYYIFELTKSRSWIPPLIGNILPTIIDAIGFIPQIILIIRMRSAIGYSLLFIITEIIGSISGIISVCLENKIYIVPLISFINILVFQLIIMVLKLFIFPERKKKGKSGHQMIKHTTENKVKSGGLIHVLRRYEIEKPIHCNKVDIIKESSIGTQEDTLDKQQLLLDDTLKDIFQNEMLAYHFNSDQSDQSIARYFINKMTNDDPFYIADVSHCAKQYVTWQYYLPNIKPFYSVKTNGNHFIIRIIEKMGGGFSCSSIAELDAVLSICPDIDCSKRIIYSHPCKPDSHIKYFKDRNVELTVADNENELIKLNTHWSNAKILIRLKVNDDNSSVLLSSQFGANERVINQLFEKAKSLRLELIGCAFHVGTGCCDKYTFKRSLQFAKQVFDISKKSKYAFNFKILDIGGGFPGVDEDGKPSFLETTTVINEAINEFFPDHQDMNIIAEPGRYFAAACMDLVTSIIASRFNNEDYLDHESIEQDRSLTMNKAEQTKNVYYINDGIYGSLPSILYKNATYCVSSLREKNPHSVKYEEKKHRSIVFGPTCDSSDCLSMSVDLPRLDIGDHLLIYNVGAYSTTCAAKFNGFQTNKYFYIWKD